MGEIYMIRNKITKDVYIGQSKYSGEYRYKQHIAEAEHTDRNLRLYNAIRKYGKENMELIILESNVPNEKLNELEIFYISKYDSFNNGYNNTSGGSGVKNYHHSDITRKKMSIGIKKSMWKINTPERTAKIIAAQKGRKFTEEHNKHIKESIVNRYGVNNPFYGKHHTVESKMKMSQSLTRYDVVQMKDDIAINKFHSVMEAAQWCIDNGYTSAKLSSAMYKVYYTCIGKQKICYGFNWKYVKKCID